MAHASRSPSDPPRAFVWHVDRYLIAVVVAALAVRVAALLVSPEHVDEAFTDRLAALGPWGAARRAVGADTHPPLHYAVVALAYDALGRARWVLRLPSVVAGVATVPVAYWIGRTIADRRVGLVAAGALALNAWHVQWSGIGRMYALLTLAVAVAWLGASRAWREVGDPRTSWFLVVAGSLTAAYSQNLGLLHTFGPIASISLLFAWRDPAQRRLVRPVTAAGALVLIGWLPWAPHLLTQFERADRALAWVDVTPRRVVGSLRRPWSGLGWLPAYVWVDAIVVTCVVAARRWAARDRSAVWAVLVMWWWLVPLVTLAFVPVRRVFIDRVFLPSVLPLSLLLAIGIVHVSDERGLRLAVILGAAFAVVQIVGILRVLNGV